MSDPSIGQVGPPTPSATPDCPIFSPSMKRPCRIPGLILLVLSCWAGPAAAADGPAPAPEAAGLAAPQAVASILPADPATDHGTPTPRTAPRDTAWKSLPALRKRFSIPPGADIKAYGVKLKGTAVERW